MNRDHGAGQRGFTVLEALVAVAVLGLVALGILRLVGETAVAAQRGEAARLRAALADAVWQLVRLDAADPRTVGSLMPEGYTWEIERTAESGSPTDGLVAVTVTVTDPSGRSFVLRSLDYRP